MSSVRSRYWLWTGLLWAACASEEPTLIASNCNKPGGCVTQEALRIDAVDILLVIDDSESAQGKAAQLKAELPRMLGAITTGQDGDVTFPPANSVHVAVTTTNMGADAFGLPACAGLGQDGVFVKPGQVGVSCDVSYPGYLAYEGGAAALSVAESAACVPLVFEHRDPEGFAGCGFEQPLEAMLKSVWPKDRDSVSFLSGQGHGTSENAGFLRDNSLLVVVVVSDEDDCSPSDPSIFNAPALEAEHSSEPVNLRCYLNKDKLQATKRYVDSLKALRPRGNLVFAAIGGIPTDLVSDEVRANYDFSRPADAERYFSDVLADARMQEVVDEEWPGRIEPSCTVTLGDTMHLAMPPRRLVEVARGFGTHAVLGSICAHDFGAVTGGIIRALGEKLNAAGE